MTPRSDPFDSDLGRQGRLLEAADRRARHLRRQAVSAAWADGLLWSADALRAGWRRLAGATAVPRLRQG